MEYCCSFLVLCRVSDETHKGKGKGKGKVAPLYTMKACAGGWGCLVVTPRRNSRIQGVRSWRATKIWKVAPDVCGSLFHHSPQDFWKICAPQASRILNLDSWRRWLTRRVSWRHSKSGHFGEKKVLVPARTGSPWMPHPFRSCLANWALGIQYVGRCAGAILVSVLKVTDACATGSTVNSFAFVWAPYSE